MASGFQDKKGWVISFRHIGQTGTKRTRKRLPAQYKSKMTKAKADQLAKMVDLRCRAVETDKDPHAIAWLLDAGFLTKEQAEKVASHSIDLIEDLRPRPAPYRVTIKGAALENPSVIREARDYPADHRYNLKKLDLFIEWAGIDRLQDVKVRHAREYIEKLQSEGRSKRYRERATYYLKLACKMAPSLCGSPNVLAGMRLDQNKDSKPEIFAFTSDELKKIFDNAKATAAHDPESHKWLAAIACMLMLGLSPTECARLDVQDVDFEAKSVRVGWRRAKNDYRKRELPACDTLLDWLRPLTVRSRKTRALIHGARQRNKRQGFTAEQTNKHLKPYLAASGQAYTQEALRSTFATIALQEIGMPARDVESFLGRVPVGNAKGSDSMVSKITAKHYNKITVEHLRRSGEKFEAWLLKAIS